MKRIISESFQNVLPLPGEGPVFLAIGMFDGVHVGHQAVLESCLQAARCQEGRAGVLTFYPHPSRLFRPQEPVKLIHSPEFKQLRLEKLGLDFMIQQTFDRSFSEIQAPDFPRLLKQIIPDLKTVYVGKNWRFGKGRAGDVSLLTEWFTALGVSVFSLERMDYNGEPVSSTRIRNLITKGEISKANELLGYYYYAEGQVVAGKRLGRQIGFPTLNLPWTPELLPCFGVYQVRVIDLERKQTWKGIANYGVRPTVDQDPSPLLEVHLLNVKEEHTLPTEGSSLRVEWLRFIRPEQRFSSIEALQQQIAADIRTLGGSDLTPEKRTL